MYEPPRSDAWHRPDQPHAPHVLSAGSGTVDEDGNDAHAVRTIAAVLAVMRQRFAPARAGTTDLQPAFAAPDTTYDTRSDDALAPLMLRVTNGAICHLEPHGESLLVHVTFPIPGTLPGGLPASLLAAWQRMQRDLMQPRRWRVQVSGYCAADCTILPTRDSGQRNVCRAAAAAVPEASDGDRLITVIRLDGMTLRAETVQAAVAWLLTWAPGSDDTATHLARY